MVDIIDELSETPRDQWELWAAKIALTLAQSEIDLLRAEVERLRAELEYHLSSARNVKTPESIPDDGYLPGMNSTMCDWKKGPPEPYPTVGVPDFLKRQSSEEQFTRRMLREAIALSLFTGLPDEREWTWDRSRLKYRDNEFSYSKVSSVALFWKPYNKDRQYKYATIPPKLWDKAWRESGME